MMTTQFETAIRFAAIGMTGIFLFMAIFYLLILLLDRLMPFREEKTEDEFVEETGTEDEDQ